MSEFRVGRRVVVRDDPGTVRFYGNTSFAQGQWVGVELDEPRGRHNGTVQDVEYFRCREKHGVFVRPSLIENASGSGSPAPAADVKSVVGKLQVKLKTAVEEIKRCKETIEALEEEAATSQGRNDELEVALESSAVELEYFRSKNTTLVESLNALQLSYNELDAERSILSEELEIHRELEETIQAQASFDTVSSEDFEVLLLHNKKLELALSSLRSVSKDRDYEFSRELQSLRDRLAPFSELKSSYESLQAKLSNSEQVIEQLQEQLESTAESEQIIERLTTDNEKLQAKVSELATTVQDLTELYELDRSLEADHLRTQEELQKTVAKLNTEMAQKRDQLSKLKSMNMSLYDEMKKLKDTSNKRQSMLLDNELENVTLELKRLKAERGANSISITMLVQNLDELSAMVTELSPDESKERMRAVIGLKKAAAYCSAIISKLRTRNMNAAILGTIYDCQRLSSLLAVLTSLLENMHGPELDSELNEMLSSLHVDFERSVAQMDLDGAFETAFIVQFVNHASQSSMLGSSNTYRAVYHGLEIETETSSVSGLLSLLEQTCGLDAVDGDIKSKIEQLESLAFETKLKSQKFRDFMGPSVELEGSCDLTFFEMKRSFSSLLNLHRDLEFSSITDLSEEFENRSIDLKKIIAELEEGSGLLDLRPKVVSSQHVSIYSFFDKAEKSDDRYDAVEASIIEKDKIIEDLHLQIELLENNLNLTASGKQTELDTVSALLYESRSEHKALKNKVDELLAANDGLEEQIRLLQNKGSSPGRPQIEAIKGFQVNEGYSKEMALLDEIELLRNILRSKLSKETHWFEDIDWLEMPLLKKQIPQPDSAFTTMARRKRAEAKRLSRTILDTPKKHRFGLFRI